MSRDEAVELYREGRIDRRMFVRALVAAGVTVASATTYARVLAPERAGAAPRPLGGDLYPPDALNFVAMWGGLGTGRKKFLYPNGIAVDLDSGNLYVTQSGDPPSRSSTATASFSASGVAKGLDPVNSMTRGAPPSIPGTGAF